MQGRWADCTSLSGLRVQTHISPFCSLISTFQTRKLEYVSVLHSQDTDSAQLDTHGRALSRSHRFLYVEASGDSMYTFLSAHILFGNFFFIISCLSRQSLILQLSLISTSGLHLLVSFLLCTISTWGSPPAAVTEPGGGIVGTVGHQKWGHKPGIQRKRTKQTIAYEQALDLRQARGGAFKNTSSLSLCISSNTILLQSVTWYPDAQEAGLFLIGDLLHVVFNVALLG